MGVPTIDVGVSEKSIQLKELVHHRLLQAVLARGAVEPREHRHVTQVDLFASKDGVCLDEDRPLKLVAAKLDLHLQGGRD